MGGRKTAETDNQKEKREDLLEYLYKTYRQGEGLTVAEYAARKEFSMRETNALVRELKLLGYIEEEKRTGLLNLTELGKMEGMDCLERHEKLTQFFQMVSGMEQEEAQEDACRIEHVISQRALEGIDGFLKYGDVYDRNYKGMDMYNVFGEGTFDILLGIYQPERRNPRLLAEEDERFESRGILRQVQDHWNGNSCYGNWFYLYEECTGWKNLYCSGMGVSFIVFFLSYKDNKNRECERYEDR